MLSLEQERQPEIQERTLDGLRWDGETMKNGSFSGLSGGNVACTLWLHKVFMRLKFIRRDRGGFQVVCCHFTCLLP